MLSEIGRVIEQVSRDKGIDKGILVSTLKEALQSAARKKLGPKAELDVRHNEDTGEIEIFQYKVVASKVTNPDMEISLKEALELDPECVDGDELGVKMDATTFGRIAAQSAKQVIIQKMKEAERDAVYKNFIDRKGEILNGIVLRSERGDLIVNLGNTEGVLSVREQVPRELYKRGDRVRAYIVDVSLEGKGPQVVLSRTHPNFLINLFKAEVPEISEGIVSIMAAAREPGVRAKIAVASSDSDVDAVGACVGMRGSRVQNVVHELRGEKIDIVPWHADAAKFVCNALAPAQISRVIIDDESHAMEVIVPDEFLSVAIGKKGQNVRLASKLTGWHLDVKSETRFTRAMQDGYNSLLALPDVGPTLADALYEKGFYSLEELSKASADDLTSIKGIEADKAEAIIDSAARALSENPPPPASTGYNAESGDGAPEQEQDGAEDFGHDGPEGEGQDGPDDEGREESEQNGGQEPPEAPEPEEISGQAE